MDQEKAVDNSLSKDDTADVFGQIRLGMEVVDRIGHNVGHVDDLYGGGVEAPAPAAPEVTPVIAAPQPAAQAPLASPIAMSQHAPAFDVLGPANDMPREVHDRLMHDGFVRIDAGFIKHHRYALRGQIDRVSADRVTLNVVAEDLIKD